MPMLWKREYGTKQVSHPDSKLNTQGTWTVSPSHFWELLLCILGVVWIARSADWGQFPSPIRESLYSVWNIKNKTINTAGEPLKFMKESLPVFFILSEPGGVVPLIIYPICLKNASPEDICEEKSTNEWLPPTGLGAYTFEISQLHFIF